MKMLTEISFGGLLLVILAMFLNPTHLLMPDSFNTMLTLGLLVGFLVFMSFVWREHAHDERETIHIHKSGRISFFAGATVLVWGIIVQAVKHTIDPWLLYALSAMVVTKLVSRIFHHFRG